MRIKHFSLLLMMIVLSSLVTAWSCNDYADALFCQDFENNNAENFSVDGGGVVSIQSELGSLALRFSTTSSGHLFSVNWSEQSNYFNVSFLNMSMGSVDTNYLRIGLAHTGVIGTGVDMLHKNGNLLYYNGVAELDSGIAFADVDNITVEVYKNTTAWVNIYVNSQAIWISQPVRGTPVVELLKNIWLYTPNVAANGHYDNIFVCNSSVSCNPSVSVVTYNTEVLLLNDSYENLTSIFENTDFFISANYSSSSGPGLTAAVCNFTAINISAHFSRTGADTTLSASSDQLDLIVSETPTNLVYDNIEFDVCRNGVKTEIEILINGSLYETIDQNVIPLCSSGTTFSYMNITDAYKAVKNINLTVQCSNCGGARTMDIVADADGDLLHYERQFSTHTEPMVYNASMSLYAYLGHKYHFTASGIGKGNISVNCNGTISNPLYDVLDVLPIVEIFTINGLTYVENMSIERADNVSILIGVSGDSIASIQFNVTNTSLIAETSTTFITIAAASINKLGNYNISILAIDDEGNFTLVTGMFIINDTAPPVISQSTPNPLNTSTFFDPDNISFVAIYTDTSLYSYGVDIERNNDSYNLYNRSAIISGTSYLFNQSINFSAQPFGTYRICHNVSDTHTSLFMKAADLVEEKTNELKYTFGMTEIVIRSLNGYEDGATSAKLTDRYTFNFKYFDKTLVKRYELSANQPITYLKDSKYKGHFLVGHYWVDFETASDVTVVLDNVRSVYIITVLDGSKDVTFDSIGERNFVVECYSFTTAATVIPSVYNNTIIDDTNWFNTDLFKGNTSSSMLSYFFILFIIVLMVHYAEKDRTPILFLFSAIVAFFFGYLIYTKMTAIVGAIFIIFGIFMLFRSFQVANE